MLRQVSHLIRGAALGLLFGGVAACAVPGGVDAGETAVKELTCGDHLRRRLEKQGVDVFTFAAEAGDVVSVTVVKEDGISTFTPILDLFSPVSSTEPVASDLFGVHEFALKVTGTYTLAVHATGTLENSYFLHLTWIHPAEKACSAAELPQAPAAPRETIVEGTVGDGVGDLYHLDALAGDRVTIDIQKVSGQTGFHPEVDVFTPGGAKMVGGARGETALELSSTGRYTVRARQNYPPDRNRAYLNLSGSYAMTVKGPEFVPLVRGDPNEDGRVDIADPVAILTHLFAHPRIDCVESGDADKSGAMDVSDGIYLLMYLFGGGHQPAPPFPECGRSEEPLLPCETFAGC